MYEKFFASMQCDRSVFTSVLAQCIDTQKRSKQSGAETYESLQAKEQQLVEQLRHVANRIQQECQLAERKSSTPLVAYHDYFRIIRSIAPLRVENESCCLSSVVGFTGLCFNEIFACPVRIVEVIMCVNVLVADAPNTS